jgi:cholinesterase
MRTILVSLCLAFITIFNPAAPQPFSDLITFGGPLEDLGNFASVNGDLPPPFFKNRFSNGPLAVEILATRFGLKVEPSLHRIGPARGNNFSSVDAFASGDEPQDLAGQLDAYLTPRGNKADPHALYYIIIGGNEVIQATYEPNDATAIQIVTRAVLAKEEAIHRLVDAGAKTILVPNFIDIGITPQIRGRAVRAWGQNIQDS